MSMTDPIADMLTRIRNACSAGHKRVDIPASKFKTELARLLRDNHYIADFKMLSDGERGVLRLYLKYHNELPVIRELHRVSAPGLRRYVKYREIPRVKNGLGMAILSTPKGLMSDSDARTAHLGGELVAVVSSRLYTDGRHEMLNEENRDEVTADFIDWVDRAVCVQTR